MTRQSTEWEKICLINTHTRLTKDLHPEYILTLNNKERHEYGQTFGQKPQKKTYKWLKAMK